VCYIIDKKSIFRRKSTNFYTVRVQLQKSISISAVQIESDGFVERDLYTGRFCRWRDKGIWEELLESFSEEPELKWLMINASHLDPRRHSGITVHSF